MNRVFILHEAELELRDAVNYYETKCSGLGLNFLREIESGLETIRNLPDLWPLRDDGTHRYLVHRFPYLVVYIYQDDCIWVIDYAHCKRRSGYWKERININKWL